MVYRHIAFVHALRLHLRKEADHTVCQPFLAEAEYETLQQKQNKPNYLTQMTGDRVRAGQGEGFLQWFHSFQIEGVLTQFANHQGASERIKNTPLPRQYEVFTRLFVYLFAILLPMGLLSLIPAPQTWIIIPLATSIAGVFTIMEKTGAANENPFENRITDVPLTALCTIIERDLREMLGETDLPARSEATNGYLY
jgi:putative membrane protein